MSATIERAPVHYTRATIAHRRRRKRRTGRVVAWVIVALLLALVAAIAWVGLRGLMAKDALERAQGLVGQLQDQAMADPQSALALVGDIQRETADARSLTSDPVWRIAEATPVLGTNLTAVRRLSAAVDSVSVDALQPLAAVASTLDVESLKPVDGRINLEPIIAAKESVATADSAISGALADVQSIDTATALAFVDDARTQLIAQLTKAVGITGTARTLTTLLPPMLGADGPRNYILMFQNNAEARSLGGNPAALVLVNVDRGAINIAQQASSGDFDRLLGSPVPLDPNVYNVYYPKFADYVMDITTRPDFPTAATLAQGYWERQFGLRADGVISFDPVALASLLGATGPVTLSTGDQLTTDNAVQLLLSDVYSRYEDPRMQDAFFAEAAQSIFGALTGGGFEPQALLGALTTATEQGRLMMWSAYPEEQEVVLTTPLSGVLPTTNEDSTMMGVYFMDQSSSKIDYWVGTSVAASSDVCSVPASPTFTATVGVRSLLTPEQARTLPAYVLSTWWKAEKFSTDIYVLGPPGSTFLDASWGTPGLSDKVVSVGTDLGRPVVRLNTFLAHGAGSSVTVRFQGGPGLYGPLDVTTTPMVKPTEVSVTDSTC